jgi:hypothetical protein
MVTRTRTNYSDKHKEEFEKRLKLCLTGDLSYEKFQKWYETLERVENINSEKVKIDMYSLLPFIPLECYIM